MDIMIEVRTNEDVSHLPWYDNTKLTAMNTCPTYASLAYGLNKYMSQQSRQLALEAGALCHDVFAFVRLYDLLMHGKPFYDKKPDWHYSTEAVYKRGNEIFGDRWQELMAIVARGDDKSTTLMQCAVYIVNSSTYYDDPNDNKRTLSNIEDAVLSYCQNYPLNRYMPVCHGDFVGVEQSFEVVISIDAQPYCLFIGKLDGLCWSADGKSIEPHENKTGARIDKSWQAGYEVAHQVTGYCVAAQAVLAKNTPWQGQIEYVQMFGLSIPQMRNPQYTYNYLRHPVKRPQHMFEAWATWLMHTIDMWNKYRENPYDAPKFTHSCNRYFSSCAYIPFCVSDREDQEDMVEGMFDRVWDPRTLEK